MSMITSVLRTARTRLARTPVYRLLARLKITRAVKGVYYRKLLKEGTAGVTLAGQHVRLHVRSAREIDRLDAFAHEAHLVQRMLDAVRPGDVFYDIGANIGVITTVVATRFRDENVHVHAFEPEPRNAAELRENVALNNLPNVSVHELGLGSENAKVPLQVSGEVGEGSHSIMTDTGRPGRDSVEIRIARASDFVGDEAPAPDAIKIDVEGAELHVLRGLEPLFADGLVREVFIEVHPRILAQNDASADDIRRLLEPYGFTLAWSERRQAEIQQHYSRAGA